MGDLSRTAANRQKLGQAKQAIDEASSEVLRRDFYGTLKVKMKIEDGTIQQVCWHVKRVKIKN